jgi:hypothetical protein
MTWWTHQISRKSDFCRTFVWSNTRYKNIYEIKSYDDMLKKIQCTVKGLHVSKNLQAFYTLCGGDIVIFGDSHASVVPSDFGLLYKITFVGRNSGLRYRYVGIVRADFDSESPTHSGIQAYDIYGKAFVRVAEHISEVISRDRKFSICGIFDKFRDEPFRCEIEIVNGHYQSSFSLHRAEFEETANRIGEPKILNSLRGGTPRLNVPGDVFAATYYVKTLSNDEIYLGTSYRVHSNPCGDYTVIDEAGHSYDLGFIHPTSDIKQIQY